MIIGLSAKKSVGKDLVAQIIRHQEGLILIAKEMGYDSFESFAKFCKINMSGRDLLSEEEFDMWVDDGSPSLQEDTFKVKRFADKLKEMVALLIGCTRAQLEDRDLKETPLGPEWWYYKSNVDGLISPYLENNDGRFEEPIKAGLVELVKQTPRMILQNLGTEGVRGVIHPNAWVNSFMSEYRPKTITESNDEATLTYPKWVVPDMRFPNEAEVVKQNGGCLIRINRPSLKSTDNHPSETALDNFHDWDYIIENDGTVSDLIKKVNTVLWDIMRKW